MSTWDKTNNSFGHSLTALDTTKKKSGSYSGRIDDNYPRQWSKYVYSDTWTPINNSQDTYYTVSGWVYVEDVTTNGSLPNLAKLWIVTRKQGERGYPTGHISTSSTKEGTWEYLSKTVLIPADVKEINVRIENARLGKVWFDDVKIVKGNASQTVIVEESNYYPFGLKHKGYNNVTSSNGNSTAQKFGFGGKELNEELGLNTMDFGARNYDASLGRWMNLDPLAEIMESESPFNYGYNNPIYYRDFDGRAAKGMLDPYLVFDGQKNKLYIYDDNDTPDDPSDDVLLGTFDAHNLTVRRSQGKWEDGTYSMYDTKTRHTHTTLETKGKWAYERYLDSPNSSYGAGGIYRAKIKFTQTDGKVREGMAIHAGRENRPFLRRKTKGCIRVFQQAMVAIDNAIIEFGSLTTITVKNNQPQKQRDPVSAVSTPTPSPIVPTPVPVPTPIVPIPPSPVPTPAPKPLPIIIPKPPIKM